MLDTPTARTRARTRTPGDIHARTAITRRILAASIAFALVFSLAATPLATAASAPSASAAAARTGVNLSELGSAVGSAADDASANAPFTVTRGQMRRPTDAVSGASADAPVAAAEDQLFSHDFETWTGPWSLWSENANGWGRSTFRKMGGSYAAYCAGAHIAAPGPYANNMNTWMTAGPFDLRQYDEATLYLDLAFATEIEHDYFAIGVSTDDRDYEMIGVSGDSGGWWVDTWVSLSDFYEDGTVDVTGNQRVWISFIFISDEANVAEGAYVDNVGLLAGIEPIEPPLPVTFVAGDTRFETAVQASLLAYPDGAGTVIIATGRNWPDALGGSALAGVLDAPILLTEPTALPAVVLEEIRSLEATHAIILGGPAAVGTQVENALKAELGTGGLVERIDGNSRYETADKVAARVIAEQGDAYDGKAFVATGGNFPDALAAAPLAAAKGWPLYLANPSTGMAPWTLTAMTGVTDVVILGGSTAVSAMTHDQLTNTGRSVTRLGGDTRYATAKWVAHHGVEYADLSWDGVGIATGENYPDALAGGVLQAKAGSVMLLTLSAQLSPEARMALETNRPDISTITIFGGLSAIGQRTRNDIYTALSEG